MAKRTSFRGISAASVTAMYCNTKMLWTALQILVLLAVPVFLVLPFFGRLSWFNGVFCAFTAVVARYFVKTLMQVRLNQFNAVLNYDCDPVKLEKIFAPLDKKPNVFNEISLNVVRALFYQGRCDEALERLLSMEKPGEKSAHFFQYYNILAMCYDRKKDLEKLLAIQQKINLVSGHEKANSFRQTQANQLLTVLELMILHQEGRITACKSACKDMYKQASYPLSRINVSLRLAELEHLSGSNHTAAERCAYIIDDGGTTFYVEEARALYRLCRGKDYMPEDGHLVDREDLIDDDDPDDEYDEEILDEEYEDDEDTDEEEKN